MVGAPLACPLKYVIGFDLEIRVYFARYTPYLIQRLGVFVFKLRVPHDERFKD